MNIENLTYALAFPAWGIIWLVLNIGMLFSTSKRWLRSLDWVNWLLTLLIAFLLAYVVFNKIQLRQDLNFSQDNIFWFSFNLAIVWICTGLIRFGKQKYLYKANTGN